MTKRTTSRGSLSSSVVTVLAVCAGVAVALVLIPRSALAAGGDDFEISAPVTPWVFDGDLRDLPEAAEWRLGDPVKEIPRRLFPPPGGQFQPTGAEGAPDPLIELQAAAGENPSRALAAPTVNVAGQGFTGVYPPDTIGDAGPNHYIQAINGSAGAIFTVYDKAGAALTGSIAMDSLATGGNCQDNGYGDPIVLYDRAADRWWLSEFTEVGNYLCIYLSQGPDPVTDGWYAYEFDHASFPDYPHYGIWPDADPDRSAYIGTTNESGASAPVYAFERAQMLAGGAAREMRSTAVPKLAGYLFQALTPADLDGAALQPSAAPGIVMRHNDDEAHSATPSATQDYLDLYQVSVNWSGGGSLTVSALPQIAITDFNSWLVDYSTFAAVPQDGTTQLLDPLREVVMHRLQYRNMGLYQSLVGNFVTNQDTTTTDPDVNAGVRWFELRKIGSGSWTLYQEGTFGPGNATYNRWMGGIAQDEGGNIALGYSITKTGGGAIDPSLRYTGRLAGDGLGTMTQGEQTIIAGSTYQDGIERWGDYAAMSVDPADDCTFWYTNEYIPASGDWETQIAAFKFSECGCANNPSSVDVTPNGPLVLCTGTGQLLTASATGGTAPLSYQWYVDGAVIPGATGTTYAANSTGTHTYNCRVTGSGCGYGVFDSLPVEISWQTAPAFSGLQSVTNAETAVCRLDLAWNAASPACGGPVVYNIYRSTTPGFTPGAANRLPASPVSGLSYSDVGLSFGTTYYYVVRAVDQGNGAEDSNLVERSGSPTGAVSTNSYPSTDTPIAIPDSPTVGISSVIDVADSGTVADILVNVDITHTYRGDLIVELTSPDGTTVRLHNRTGSSDDDIVTTYDSLTAPDGPGTMADFDGEGVTGSWTLYVEDEAGGDTGTLNEWSLDVDVGTTCLACANNPTSVDVSPDGPITECQGTGVLLTATRTGGSGPFEYRWYEDGAPVTPWTVGASTYTASSTGSHTYNCEVRGAGCTDGEMDPSDVSITWQYAPSFAGLQSVTNPATGPCLLDLAWDAATSVCPGPLVYNIYRSTTSGFTPGPANLLAASPVAGLTHADSDGLVTGTRYYYVVRALDQGSGAEDANLVELSAVPTGPPNGTTNYPSTDTPIAIPDATTPGITSPLSIGDSGVIADILLNLDIAHTYKGDLIVELTSPMGTTVRVHNRTGSSTDNIVTTYDTLTLPDGPGTMADFDGEDLAGDWTLYVEDAASGDTGTLNSWSLDVTLFGPCCDNNPTAVDVTPNGPVTVCQGTGVLLTATPTGGVGLSYQWYQDGGPIPGATSSTYTANTTGTHSYNCEVTGSGCPGGVMDPADVQVSWQYAPTFAGLQSVTNAGFGVCTLNLAWNVASTVCPGPVVYNVYRDTTPGFTPGPANLLAASPVAGLNYSDSGLTFGTTYYYVVRALDQSNGAEDANLVERSGTPTGPGGGPLVLLEDDFETDWTVTGNWTVSTGPGPHTCGPWTWTNSGTGRPTGSTGSYALTDSDACGSGSTTSTILTSRALDASDPGLTSLTVEADHFFNWYGSEEATVEVWDGSAWQVIWQHSGVDEDMHRTWDVTAFANAVFRVRFSYQNASYAMRWAVDNVVVTADIASPCTSCSDNPLTVDVTPNGPVTVCQGTGVTLTATPSGGTPPLAYQWYADGASIPGATGSSYVANTTGTHTYNCEVTGGTCPDGTFDAAAVSVTWQYAPTFAGLQSVTNTEGSYCALLLEWDAASTVCSGPVVYNVYRSTTPGFTPGPANLLVASPIAGLSHLDQDNLVTGTAYYYVVRAVDQSNGAEDANLVERSGTPTGPSGVVELLNDDFETDWTVTGNWTVSTGPGPHDCGEWQWTNSGTGRPTGSTGSYALTDSDACGSGSNTSTILTSRVLGAGDPGLVSLIVECDHFFDWYGGESATVEVFDGSGWQVIWQHAGADENMHRIWDVTAYANAGFQVRFSYQNASYDMRWAVDNVVVTADIPNPCTTDTGCLNPPSFSGIQTAGDVDACEDSGVRITWQLPSNWNDAGGTRSFVVLRDWVDISGPLGETTTSFVDTTGTNGVTYTYGVRASNGDGCATDGGANLQAADQVGALPTFAGLSWVARMPGVCGLRLEWTDATPGCGASGASMVYNVYRSTTAGFTPGPTNRLARCVPGLYFEDTTVSSGTTYYYVVRSEDSSIGHGGPCNDGYEDANLVHRSGSPLGSVVFYDDFDGSQIPADYWSFGFNFANPYPPGDPSGCDAEPMDINQWYRPETGWCDGNSLAMNDGAADPDYQGIGSSNSAVILGLPPTAGGPPYSDGGLVLPAGATAVTLSFDHVWDLESDTTPWDGARIMLSVDDGSTPWDENFVQIDPVGGYPGITENSTSYCHPWPNTPAYTLMAFNYPDCRPAVFDLTPWIGERVWIAWNFGGDNWPDTPDDGWFIDNVLVESQPGTCAAAPEPVQAFTATATSGQNKLEWVNPSAGSYGSTMIRFSLVDYPQSPTYGTLLTVDVGTAGAYGTYTHGGLTNNQRVYYAAFVDNGSGQYSAMRTVSGRPFDTAGAAKWEFNTGATALAPPSIGSVYGVSNDRFFHSMNPGTLGGDWPATWQPMVMNGPAQGRPPIANLPSGVPAAKTAFLGSLDGFVYAVDANTGNLLWQSEDDLTMVLGAPAARFSDFAPGPNLVFAGSRIAAANNAMYAFNVPDGSSAWSYGGFGGSGRIGIISGKALVHYATSRLYFASRERGGAHTGTLWCLEFNAGSASLCAGSWPLRIGDIDGSPMKRGNVIYVGTNASLVYAVDATTGALLWSSPFACNDGAVKGYVWPDFASTDIYLSTSTKLWRLTDNGGSASLAWSSAAVADPSIPLYTPGGSYLVAGSSDGRLYQFDFSAGPSMTSVTLGEGTGAVGSPALDVVNNLYYVGAESGAMYAVAAPF